MDFINYYKVMGVADHATHEAIKQAYRKLARKFHPDVSQEPDADARFKALGEAYAVLKNTKKRTRFDQSRALHSDGGKRRSAKTGTDISDGKISPEPKVFSKSAVDAGKVGSGGHRPTVNHGPDASSRGQDLHHRLVLSLEEAVQGIQRTLKLKIPTVTTLGYLYARSKMLTVKIPAGVVSGQCIRLAGQGGPGRGGGAPGDCLLEIELAQHPLFIVAGRDVLLSLPVANWEVALGARVEVPTLAGPVNLTIPTESVSGKKLRLKGRGLGLNPTGDMIVNLHVMVPERHWTKAEALYREVADM